MLVTLANIVLSRVLQSENADNGVPVEIMRKRRNLLWIDVAIKVAGLVIAFTIYPPAMMYSVIFAAAFLMIGIRRMKIDWDHI